MIIGLPQAALPLLATHTHVPLDIAGGIFTGTSLGAVLGRVLAELLSRRWHTNYLLATGVAIMGVATLVGLLTQMFAILFITQCLQGGGFGLLNVSLNLVVASAFRDE